MEKADILEMTVNYLKYAQKKDRRTQGEPNRVCMLIKILLLLIFKNKTTLLMQWEMFRCYIETCHLS